MAKRTLGVQVMSRLRRAGLVWPRAATAFLSAPAVRRVTVGIARRSARLGVAQTRSIPVDLIVDGSTPVDGGPLVVRRVWRSGAVLPIAGSVERDRASVTAIVRRLPVLSANQRLLLDMSWTEARPILYQPVAGADVADWVLVRRCDDRFSMMRTFLTERGVTGEGRTYVDLACNYGWFVHAMEGLGFEARGVELDERAPELARRFYGVDPTRIIVGDVLAHLGDPANDADILSCFSLVHHFVVTKQAGLVDQVMADLGRRSRLGFFFDMGESHEGWLRERLAGWTPEVVADRLRAANPGMTVHVLGIDGDRRGVHATEYGRTLFAVWRD